MLSVNHGRLLCEKERRSAFVRSGALLPYFDGASGAAWKLHFALCAERSLFHRSSPEHHLLYSTSSSSELCDPRRSLAAVVGEGCSFLLQFICFSGEDFASRATNARGIVEAKARLSFAFSFESPALYEMVTFIFVPEIFRASYLKSVTTFFTCYKNVALIDVGFRRNCDCGRSSERSATAGRRSSVDASLANIPTSGKAAGGSRHRHSLTGVAKHTECGGRRNVSFIIECYSR
jgi:hypothetical protein